MSSQTLIDVALTTNVNIIDTCKIKSSTISDHSLVSLTLKLKAPKPRCLFVTTRSYKNYNSTKFAEDLTNAPFHVASIFDDFDDRRPNPFITPEIRHLMKTRDTWHKRANKTKDKLHWNAYRFFRQEVKREIRIAEKEHIRTELLNSNGNTTVHLESFKPLSHKEGSTFYYDRKTLNFKLIGLINLIPPLVRSQLLRQRHSPKDILYILKTSNLFLALQATTKWTMSALSSISVEEGDGAKIVNSLPSNKAPGYDQVTA